MNKKVIAIAVTLVVVITGIILSVTKAAEPKEASIDRYLTLAKEQQQKGNHAAALELLKKAADEYDSPVAQYYVSLYYQEGQTVPADSRLAKQYLEKSASNGLAVAQFRLGLSLTMGMGGYKEDNEEGFKWLLLAAEKNHAEAQYFAGTAYLKGIGVKVDNIKGKELLERSADQGFDMAQYDQGKLYLLLAERSKDSSTKSEFLIKAAEYLMAAAKQGHEDAQKAVIGLSKMIQN